MKQVAPNHFVKDAGSDHANQQQTNDVFSDKWEKVNATSDLEEIERFQKAWFLDLYGFGTETAFAEFLADKSCILDAGCGIGYKAAWVAGLAPHATVIGIDYSDALGAASEKYSDVANLVFVQADIADTGLTAGSVDFVYCDQVIMHTQDPDATFAHLSGLLSPKGEFACYVYAKKALPRELIDDHFRKATHDIAPDQLWELSEQLTELGKRMSALNATFDCPDIPLLGIKGGEYDVQRFVYWNFLKCFWNPQLGPATSVATNFDWYSPSNARRFSRDEFQQMATTNALKTVSFHAEEACYSARFART